jgi:hypothetical protein
VVVWPAHLKKTALTAVVVGTILFAINQLNVVITGHATMDCQPRTVPDLSLQSTAAPRRGWRNQIHRIGFDHRLTDRAMDPLLVRAGVALRPNTAGGSAVVGIHVRWRVSTIWGSTSRHDPGARRSRRCHFPSQRLVFDRVHRERCPTRPDRTNPVARSSRRAASMAQLVSPVDNPSGPLSDRPAPWIG